MATVSADSLRETFAGLGQRRVANEAEDRELTAEIKKALAQAQGVLSRSEVAQLLHMHRTTLYRVYLS